VYCMFICFIAVLEKNAQNYFTPFWGMVIFDLYCTSNLIIAWVGLVKNNIIGLFRTNSPLCIFFFCSTILVLFNLQEGVCIQLFKSSKWGCVYRLFRNWFWFMLLSKNLEILLCLWFCLIELFMVVNALNCL
jgi:hypothetical protein